MPGAGRVSGVRGELAVLRRRPGPAVRRVGRVAVPGLPVRCCAAPDHPATTTSQEGQGGRLGRAADDARATDAGRPRAGPLSMPGAARRRLPTVKATGLHACCTFDRRERRRPPARAHEHSPARHTHTLWITRGKACEGWFVLPETRVQRGRTPCGRPEQAPSGSARPQAKPRRAAQARGPWRGSRGIRRDPLPERHTLMPHSPRGRRRAGRYTPAGPVHGCLVRPPYSSGELLELLAGQRLRGGHGPTQGRSRG